jgi:hypothetical protein
MEAMLGTSLYSYPYLKLGKNTMSFLLLLMSTLQQNWRRGQSRFCLEARGAGGRGRECEAGDGGEMAQTMCAQVNIKIKKLN